jgi:hypothetical protein
MTHFDEGVITGTSADLAGATQALNTLTQKMASAERLALKKVMPHRDHAGEHEQW